MNSQLIIDVNPRTEETCIALLEDNQLIEYRSQKKDSSFAVGDIYLGNVRKVMQNHNAAFVDIGYRREGFLHMKDLGVHYNFMLQQTKLVRRDVGRGRRLSGDKLVSRFTYSEPQQLPGEQPVVKPERHGKIVDFVKGSQLIMVQVAREPYANKGPSLTTEISIAGRNIVLLPFSARVHISSKISNKDEVLRLRRLMQSILPKGLGAIVRTAAEGMKVGALHHELSGLLERWEKCLENLQNVQKAPSLLLGEISSSSALLRDNLNGTYSSIQVNDKKLYTEIRGYLEDIAPKSSDIVKLYTSAKVPIFDHFDVTKQLKRLLGHTVYFHKGSYLIIQHPEAFHVIDVNSGSGAKNAETPEATAFEVNYAACDEVARQLRLRDMGGIIVIDFIDMADAQSRRKIYERMRDLMAKDKVTHKILEITDFGLMQITRQRHRPEERMDTTEQCPACNGTGKVESTLVLEDEIESKIALIAEKHSKPYIELHTHPFIAAYYTKGIFNRARSVSQRCKCKLKVVADTSLAMLDYEFYDKEGNEYSI